jgi:hypothetical protein
MSSRSEFEEFARDCVRLARQANSLELREKLFDIAREWMRAAMEREDARKTTPRQLPPWCGARTFSSGESTPP